MKNTLIILGLSVIVMGAGWDERVDSYLGTHGDPHLYTASDNGTKVIITKWPESWKIKPTTEQLIAEDPKIEAAKAAEAKLAQDKLDLRNMGEQGLVAMATSFGITNRPVPMTVFGGIIQSVLATNKVTGQELVNSYMLYKDFFVGNGGDLWKVGASK